MTITTGHGKKKNVDSFDEVYSGITSGENFILNKTYPGTGKPIDLKMHYLPQCPYSKRALMTLLDFPHSLNVHFFNGFPPQQRAKVKKYIHNYQRLHNISLNANSMPQLFTEGFPLGGSDTLRERLEQLVQQ